MDKTTIKFEKKEKVIFWSAILAGMAGGIIGNILVGYIFSFRDNPTLINSIGVIIFTAIFFGLIFFVRNKIKQNVS